jgi:hypothetical protein
MRRAGREKHDPATLDYERVRYQVEHAHEYMLDVLARREARRRVESERTLQRRPLLRRLIPFLR